MSQDPIEELLVEWELARQQECELAASKLCQHVPQLEELLEQQIAKLKRTSWMLDDPAADFLNSALLREMSESTKPDPMPSNKDTKQARIEGSPLPGDQVNSPLAALEDPQFWPAIPGFRLLNELGRGGFGVVFRAVDEKLNRHVAIKIPLLDDPTYREKYIVEARNAALLDVPGIVPVLQVGTTTEGAPFVVQKLIVGMSLAEVISQGGRLSATQVIPLMVAICKAVGLAHSQGLVHRDLKPANILIDEEGLPWVSDFGLAITEEEQADRRGEIAGTPSYMAPEQIQGKVDWLDGRTDIWALGVILYESLAGTRPFKSPSRAQLHNQILQREPRPICQRLPDLPRQWDLVFQKCCSKSIKDRYNNAFDLAADLMTIETSVGSSSRQQSNSILPERTQPESTQQSTASGVGTLHSAGSGYRRPLVMVIAVVLMSVFLWSASSLLRKGLWPSGTVAGSLPGIAPTPVDPAAAFSSNNNAALISILVSADGLGTHSTLQAAIAAARQGQEIVVGPGVYRESLSIENEVRLRGKGALADVLIMGVDGPAFRLESTASLVLTGLSVAAESRAKMVNTIEVLGGRLTLNDCLVSADGYDCVRLSSGSEFSADGCHFRSSRHPAVYANSVDKLEVRKCQFDVQSTQADAKDLVLAGIQVIKSGGSISRCTFTGKQATAIDWRETAEPAIVNDCEFESVKCGVAAYDCQQLRLGGIQQSAFSSCTIAIDLQGCGGNIVNCTIQGGSAEDSTGIRIRGNALVESQPLILNSCQFVNLNSALKLNQARVQGSLLTLRDSRTTAVTLLNNSHCLLTESKVENSAAIGILIENSSAELERCEIVDSGVAGLVVDGLDQALATHGCWINANAVGIILMSGSIELKAGEMDDNDTGIVVARRHLLNHEPTCDAPLHIESKELHVGSRQRAVQFLSPGSYRFAASILSDPTGGHIALGKGLVEQASGDITQVRLQSDTAGENK